MYILISILIGFLLDLIIGDPKWIYHPIRIIGNGISIGEKIIRKVIKRNELLGGILLSFIIIILSTSIPYAVLYVLGGYKIYLKVIVEAIFISQIMATKSLKTESMKVYKCLEKNDILNSRKYLSYIVGRDTKCLNKEEIVKATVETIAENASDGVVAPLFYIFIGGAPLGFLYKAINTLDSMIGYKNEKYFYFGKFAAKLDDIFNFIPAIISSYIMIFASFILKFDYKNAFKIYRRDKYNSSSPNSAKTESVAAGALNIQLLGDAYYLGKLVKKKTIGDKNRNVNIEDIILMNKLMYKVAIFSFIIFFIIRTLGVFII